MNEKQLICNALKQFLTFMEKNPKQEASRLWNRYFAHLAINRRNRQKKEIQFL